jgi:hypothetical protein
MIPALRHIADQATQSAHASHALHVADYSQKSCSGWAKAYLKTTNVAIDSGSIRVQKFEAPGSGENSFQESHP